MKNLPQVISFSLSANQINFQTNIHMTYEIQTHVPYIYCFNWYKRAIDFSFLVYLFRSSFLSYQQRKRYWQKCTTFRSERRKEETNFKICKSNVFISKIKHIKHFICTVISDIHFYSFINNLLGRSPISSWAYSSSSSKRKLFISYWIWCTRLSCRSYWIFDGRSAWACR